MLAFERISLRDLRDFLHLSISDPQKAILRASNFKTLWQSVIYAAYSKLFVIRNGETLVGYIYLYCYDRTKKYNIGRLVIDARHQGRGYGKAALSFGTEHLFAHGAPRVLLSVHPDNAAARKLYEKTGFCYLPDSRWGDELVMALYPSECSKSAVSPDSGTARIY